MNPEEIRRFTENQAAAALRERVEMGRNPPSADEAFRAALALLRFDEACSGSPFAREDRVSQAEDELVRAIWARLRAKWLNAG